MKIVVIGGTGLIGASALEVVDSRNVYLVDLVGIEPTTSSMPFPLEKCSPRAKRVSLYELFISTPPSRRHQHRLAKPSAGYPEHCQ